MNFGEDLGSERGYRATEHTDLRGSPNSIVRNKGTTAQTVTAWRGIVNFSRIYSSSKGTERRAGETIGWLFASIKSLPRRARLSLCNRNDGGQKLSPVFSIRPRHNSGRSRFMGDVSPGRWTADEGREKRIRWFEAEKVPAPLPRSIRSLVFPGVCKGGQDSGLKAY